MSTDDPGLSQEVRDVINQATEQSGAETVRQNLTTGPIVQLMNTYRNSGRVIMTVSAMVLLTALLGIVFFAYRISTRFTGAPSSPPLGTFEKRRGGTLTVEYILKVEDLDYSLRYSAGLSMTATTGGGSGHYRERGVSTAPSERCTVTREADLPVDVTIHPDINVVNATIIAPVRRVVEGDQDCSANVEKTEVTSVTCGFENVDLVRGGRYHGSADEPRSGEGGDIYQRTCTLDLDSVK